MVLTFIKEILFALLLMVSIIVPPIYLGYQIIPEFRKKRYIVYLLMMQVIAGKTFFEIMYLEVLIFFYLIFYMNRKKKGESLFLSFYLFSFYQSIRYLLVLFYIRMLDIDMLSEVGNGIVNSSFSLGSFTSSIWSRFIVMSRPFRDRKMKIVPCKEWWTS